MDRYSWIMSSIAALLATDSGNRCLRTVYRVASVLLAEWIFHFLYPGSCWCWVLYENGKKKRLFDFASWLIFVSLTNIIYPMLLTSAQKMETTWTESEAGRNVLCLSKIFGLRIIWQVIGGLMIGVGMRGKHQLHHYVRSDVQLMFGHVVALAFLMTTFWQGDQVVTGKSDRINSDVVTPDAEFNESDNDPTRPRPFSHRPMFNGSAIHRAGPRLQTSSDFRFVVPAGAFLQKPMSSRRESRSPTPNKSMRSLRASLSAPRKRSLSTLSGKRNSKPRKRYPSGVNNLNNSLVKPSTTKLDNQWMAWNASMRSQKHPHHHDHQLCHGKGKGTCSKNRYADSGTKDDAKAKAEVGMWSNRSSCKNRWNHWHQFDPSMPGSSQHAHSRSSSSRMRSATGSGCTSGYG